MIGPNKDPLAAHAAHEKPVVITDPTKSVLTPLPVLRDFSPREKIKHPPLPPLPAGAGAHAPKIPTKHVPPPPRPLPRPLPAQPQESQTREAETTVQQTRPVPPPSPPSFRSHIHAAAALGGAVGVGGGGSGVSASGVQKLVQISGLAIAGTTIKEHLLKMLDSVKKCFACFASISSGGQGKAASALEAAALTKKELVVHTHHLSGSAHIKYQPVSGFNKLHPASLENVRSSPELKAFASAVPEFDSALQKGDFSKALEVLSKSPSPKELIRAITKETITASKDGNSLLKEALLHGSDSIVKELCMRFRDKNVLAEQIKKIPVHILQREDVQGKLEKAIGADQLYKIAGDAVSTVSGRVKADEVPPADEALPPAPPVLVRQNAVDRGRPAKLPASPQAKALAEAAQAKVQTRMKTRASVASAGTPKEQLMLHPQFSKAITSNIQALTALEGEKTGKWIFGSNEGNDLVVYKKLPRGGIQETVIRTANDLLPFRPDNAIVVN